MIWSLSIKMTSPTYCGRLPTPHHQNHPRSSWSSGLLQRWVNETQMEHMNPIVSFYPWQHNNWLYVGLRMTQVGIMQAARINRFKQLWSQWCNLWNRDFWSNSWGTFPTRKAEGTQSLDIQEPAVAVNGCPSLAFNLKAQDVMAGWYKLIPYSHDWTTAEERRFNLLLSRNKDLTSYCAGQNLSQYVSMRGGFMERL